MMTLPPAQPAIFDQHLDALTQSIAAARSMGGAVQASGECLLRCLQQGGKIMLCGNGGSAAHAQHLAAEMVGRFQHSRRALAAMALSVDSSALTCIANDFGFEQVFARQVEGLARAGDVLVAISTSGQSPNVFYAARAARQLGLPVIGLLGKGGGALGPLCDHAVVVPQGDTARIQELHIVIGHSWCDTIEQGLQLTC